MLLESVGHEVRVVHDAEQALAAIKDSSFDALVLDIGLPGMDGYMLARHLRAHDNARGATFIALTGYGSASDKHRAGDAGFDHYLVKPADLGELARLLA
jgi:DNA-binding response OmpR family regulator